MDLSTFIRRIVAAGLVLLVVVACSEPLPTTRPPDEELREQIHAATGHEPVGCTDFTAGDAELSISSDGFEPACLMVAEGSTLTVVNETDVEHTFTVSDAGGGDVVRHIRVDGTLPAGGEYVLDPVDSLIRDGIYPFWSKDHQEEGYAGTLIVRP